MDSESDSLLLFLGISYQTELALSIHSAVHQPRIVARRGITGQAQASESVRLWSNNALLKLSLERGPEESLSMAITLPEPVKSPQDKRVYRHIKLSNQLDVLLIEDPEMASVPKDENDGGHKAPSEAEVSEDEVRLS